MDLYLVRHAAAHDRNPELWPDDAKRPLTPEGEKDFERFALGLARFAPKVDALLSSPYERAWRTAEILADLDRWPNPKASTLLEPTLPPEKVAGELRAYERASTVALVGHRPCLHELAAYLLTGDASGADITIKKGGALCLRFDGPVEPGSAQLRWLVTPKILRSLG